MAALSGGTAEAGQFVCPVHIRTFYGNGRCRACPGFSALKLVVQVHSLTGSRCIQRLVESRTAGTVPYVAENILDATHIHFTHSGDLRGPSRKGNLWRRRR